MKRSNGSFGFEGANATEICEEMLAALQTRDLIASPDTADLLNLHGSPAFAALQLGVWVVRALHCA
jgi:hypothetical protein